MTRIVVLSPIPLLHMLSSNSAKREFLCLNVVPDMQHFPHARVERMLIARQV